jgi:hypothetical protein
MASRTLAERTFAELGVGFGPRFPFSCRGLPGGYPLRSGDVPQSVDDECEPDQRPDYPPAISSPIWNHLAYTRFAALLWTFPWSFWGASSAADGVEATPRGLDSVGRAGGGSAKWFGLGYLDRGGQLNSYLAPGTNADRTAPTVRDNGFLEQEFSHAIYPFSPATFAFFDNDATWSGGGPGLYCGGTTDSVATCPQPDTWAFASEYARTSEDHDFIETWRRYRLGNGNGLRQRVANGLCCGLDVLQKKYDFVRDVIYGGQEFHEGKRCTAATCPAPDACDPAVCVP